MPIRFETVEKITGYVGGVFTVGWFLLLGRIMSSPFETE